MNYNVLTRNHTISAPYKKPQPHTSVQQKPCNIPLTKKLRELLANKFLSINQYDEIIDDCSDPRLVSALQKIKDEEIIHTGELLSAINFICTQESQLRKNGETNFNNQNQ